jgi:hypothetical protein
VIVSRSVLLVLLTLISPVDSDLRVKDLTAVECLKGGLGGTHVHVFDETVVETTVLIVAVRDNFYMLNGASDRENFGEHVFRDAGAEIANIKMSAPLNCRDWERRG